jgi:hypothetical protein
LKKRNIVEGVRSDGYGGMFLVPQDFTDIVFSVCSKPTLRTVAASREKMWVPKQDEMNILVPGIPARNFFAGKDDEVFESRIQFADFLFKMFPFGQRGIINKIIIFSIIQVVRVVGGAKEG